MTEEIYKSCDICKTDYDGDDIYAPFIYNKDKKLLVGDCYSNYGYNSCYDNTYILTEDLDISNCCNNCFTKLYENCILLYNGNGLIEDILDNLNEPIEKCSTNYLQKILKNEEKRIELSMRVLDKIKDILKSRGDGEG